MRDLIALTAQAVNQGYRYIVQEGGTRSGKTHSNLMTLYHITNSRPSLSSVVSESVPHLKRGAMRDYKRILQSQNAWSDKNWNKTDYIHQIADDKMLEFFSADNSDKVHGPERDYLFINEAQNISYETVRQLFVRTRKAILIDFNPTREFWVHTELKNDPKTLWIHSTYKDNPFLTPEQVAEIERNKSNKTWWSIYGEGKVAESEGAVYTGWRIIDSIPFEARLVRRGLDFGYSNDPTAIVDIYYHNGGYILHEQLYRKGLGNREIAEFLKSLENQTMIIMADSAEPKSIDEIRSYGVSILPATKGKDSINQGIQFVQGQKISVTKQSTNLIKEYRNYLWKTDRDGKILNVPDDLFNHLMDALRYGFDGLIEPSHITKRLPQYQPEVDSDLGF